MSFVICPKCHQMRDERRTECDKLRGGCGYVDPEPSVSPAEPTEESESNTEGNGK
jgi:hypothetical protein